MRYNWCNQGAAVHQPLLSGVGDDACRASRDQQAGGHAFAGLVSRIEQVHQAIGGRAFGSIGPVSAPVRIIHDFVARGAYRAVRNVGSAAGALGGEAASLVGAMGDVVPLASLLLAGRRSPC